jgi:hypothetical protein
VGDKDSMAHPWRSTWVRIIEGEGGGMEGKRWRSDWEGESEEEAEKEKTWIVVGDL